MGPRLGRAFLAAYDKGELGKAAALIKASEVSTGAAKNIFITRVLTKKPGNTIHLTPDDVVVKMVILIPQVAVLSPADTRIPVIRMRC